MSLPRVLRARGDGSPSTAPSPPHSSAPPNPPTIPPSAANGAVEPNARPARPLAITKVSLGPAHGRLLLGSGGRTDDDGKNGDGDEGIIMADGTAAAAVAAAAAIGGRGAVETCEKIGANAEYEEGVEVTVAAAREAWHE